jgi:hypothetical protein
MRTQSIIEMLHNVRVELEKQGVKPAWIKLSPNAHEMLVRELNKRDGKKHVRIYEIMGLRVDIEDECPPGAAYMGGDDDEMLR